MQVTDDENFLKDVLCRSDPVLVIFTARDCVLCEALELSLPTLQARLGAKIEIVRCPLDRSVRTFRRYGIGRVPALVIFNSGVALAAHHEMATIPAIERWVRTTLHPPVKTPGLGDETAMVVDE